MKDHAYRSYISIPNASTNIGQIPRESSWKQNYNPLKQKPTSKDFQRIFAQNQYSSDSTHDKLLQTLRKLGSNQMKDGLQQFCINQFNELPLLMLYEISKEFNLQVLSSKCKQNLVNENYEQLNINKFDLVKLSFPTFQKLLREYRAHANNLDIYGLKQSDLKSIVDDYCLNAAMHDSIKKKLYEQFVVCNNFIPNSDAQKQVRRSMINLNKVTVPLENTYTPDRRMKKFESVPELGIDENMIVRASDSFKSSSPSNSPCLGLIKNETKNQAAEVRKMIEEMHERQNELYSQIVDISKQCSRNPNKRIIGEGIRNLEKEISNFERQWNRQKNRLSQLYEDSKMVNNIEDNNDENLDNEMNFVFQF